jgi:imidazolonepropionase-like amidohydrolase
MKLRSVRFGMAAVAAGMCGAAGAQDLGVKAPPQKKPVVIHGATVHTVSGETIPDGYVYFEGGVIRAVGKEPLPRFAAAPEIIDGRGKHVYPGLIVAYTQLGLTEIQSVRATIDSSETGGVTPEVRAAVAVNPDSTLLPVTRTNGVLIAGVFPTGGRLPGRASVMRMDGWTWEEMAVKADAGLSVSWPNVRPVSAPWMTQSDTEQSDEIRRSLAGIDDAFTLAAAYAAARDADPNLPMDLRWEAMRGVMASGQPAGTSKQLPVFITAGDVDQITTAVAWAVEKKLKPVIVGGRDAPLCADLLKRHDVPVIVLGTHAVPRRNDSAYDEAYTLPARLHAAGLKFAIAFSDDTAHTRNLPYHAAMAVAFGLDHDAAIKSQTLWAAEILGVGDALGSIETGKAATLIVTDGDPLEITTRTERAYIDGRAIDLSNKQTKLAEKYREKYEQKKR